MTEPAGNRGAESESDRAGADPMRYPENHVVAVLDAPEQVGTVLEGLTAAGFRSSDVTVACGQAAAAALEASTGRKGLSHLAIRIAERIGLANDEMRLKDRYEEALRDGRFVLLVPAVGDDEKTAAAQVLRDDGGHLINYLGRFTIERLHD